MESEQQLLDDIQKREIVAILSAGGSRRVAARYVGLSVDAIRRQMDRDEQFAAEVRQAETRPELLLLRQITAAAADPRQWRAAAWLLERKYFERYARRGPTTIGSEQLADALAELASVLVAEVRDEADRERVRQRIASLVGRMEQGARRLPAPSEAPDGEP